MTLVRQRNGFPRIDKLSNGRIPWMIYGFFGVHMLMFGLSGFLMAYGSDAPDLLFVYLHGGIAIFVYLAFYLTIFGRDAVGWMLLNAALGLMGIYAQIGWIVDLFGRDIHDFGWPVHVIPFLYYILYTFLLRQFLIDLTGSRDKPRRRAWFGWLYVVGSLLVYGAMLWLG